MNTIYNEALLSAVRTMLPDFLSKKRFAHTLAVEEECAALTSYFVRPMLLSAEDGMKLRLAALLHDITKEKKPEEQIALCRAYAIPLTDYEKASPKVLHAKTAAAFAAEHLQPHFEARIVDDAIADAIYTHTTGAARMSLIGKLLYLADYIEATRTFADCITLRHAFYNTLEEHIADTAQLTVHLDRVLLLSFDMTIKDLISEGHLIDANTTAARNALLFGRTIQR